MSPNLTVFYGLPLPLPLTVFFSCALLLWPGPVLLAEVFATREPQFRIFAGYTAPVSKVARSGRMFQVQVKPELGS